MFENCAAEPPLQRWKSQEPGVWFNSCIYPQETLPARRRSPQVIDLAEQRLTHAGNVCRMAEWARQEMSGFASELQEVTGKGVHVNEHEIWRSIPPEEKFEIMANAHASGVVAAFITILISSTISIGLKVPMIMWGSIIAAPFIFQFAAGKKWRDVKPRTMLEYLAARSAARRFAFAQKGHDLTLRLMFRGKIEHEFDQDFVQEALEAIIADTKEAEVWVALFGDTVVMMQEQAGGAMLSFAHLLDEKLQVSASGGSDDSDYSNNREVRLSYYGKDKVKKQVKLTSRYPAALVVFEKKLQMLKAEVKASASRALPDAELADDSDSDNQTFVFE